MYSAWLTRMSELWWFVYIKSHMTLHVKPNAEKVNTLACVIDNKQFRTDFPIIALLFSNIFKYLKGAKKLMKP